MLANWIIEKCSERSGPLCYRIVSVEQLGTLAIHPSGRERFDILFWPNGTEPHWTYQAQTLDQLLDFKNSIGSPLSDDQVTQCRKGKPVSGFGLLPVGVDTLNRLFSR